ncbi:MAG: hypothetical protein JSR17_06030 [Proteobacteria bacterium]|nr:hypothetical protein [Pseudomonadota bacterium]
MHYKKYLQVFCLALLVLSLPCGINGLFLYNIGEFAAPEKVAALQSSDKIQLAAFATHDLTFPYKLALYKTAKPEIVALGSSRVMPFRQNQFSAKFLNLSRAMNSVDQGYVLVDELLKIHRPKIVILALDYWWFFEPTHENINYYVPPKDAATISINLLLKPFVWLYEGKISWDFYLKSLFTFSINKEQKHLGLKATLANEGFAKDGSYYHTGITTGLVQSTDIQFKETLSLISESKGFYTHSLEFKELHLQRLNALINKLTTAGIKTYVFIPPMAPTVLKKISENKAQYAHIDEFLNKMNSVQNGVYHFHNANTLAATDCQFLDGCHGGETLYLKILLSIAKQDESKILEKALNLDYIHHAILKYESLSMVPNKDITSQNEVDYLKIGCKRQSS